MSIACIQNAKLEETGFSYTMSLIQGIVGISLYESMLLRTYPCFPYLSQSTLLTHIFPNRHICTTIWYKIGTRLVQRYCYSPQ